MAKQEFEMTEADLAQLYEAMKPVPLIMVGGMCGPSQQERANDAWQMLGDKMGFDHMSVEPIRGKGERFFMAVPAPSRRKRMSISPSVKDSKLYRRFRASVRKELSYQERSHKSLALDIGITNVQFSNIMCGKCDPTLSMCCRIAEALGVPVEDLIA